MCVLSECSSCLSRLLPDDKKKFKTRVFRDSTNPVWNEQFVFEKLKLSDLRSNSVVELTVWDLLKNTKHYDFIGGLRLGPRPHHEKQLQYMDSSDTELSHWMSVMDTPDHCVEQLHTLRHTMDPRPVTLATNEPTKVTNQTTAIEEIITGDMTATGEAITVAMTTTSNVTSQQEVIRSHDPLPQHEPTPVTATMVTQPNISITTEDTHPEVRIGYHGKEESPVRTEKVKFDDDDDHSSNTTPSHQVIILPHPYQLT